jgi:HTH-type transcriptional regulator/antitoxin HigA
MDENQFLNEFYKMLAPADAWQGQATSIKAIFEARLAQHGITQNQAEKLLNMQKRTLDGILDGSAKRIDVINLLKLGQFLGLETNHLIKLFLSDMPADMIGELEDAKKKAYILANFDIKNLAKAGFLKTKTDFEEIEQRILKFFGLRTIFDYTQQQIIPAFSRTKKNESALMREFWVRSAYAHFERLKNPNIYNRSQLVDLLGKIRPYTMNVSSGLRTVTQALYNIGVTVIYQQHLENTSVRGATFVIEGKPCIVLTDLNKNYATVWFALLHELHHVLYDYDEIQQNIFHLTGEPDLFLLQEDKADEFARNYLLPDDRAKFIYKYINNQLLVSNFAKENQIHASFIYNFYCWDMKAAGKGDYWAKFNNLIRSADLKLALKDINIDPFDKERVEDTVLYLKENIFNI